MNIGFSQNKQIINNRNRRPIKSSLKAIKPRDRLTIGTAKFISTDGSDSLYDKTVFATDVPVVEEHEIRDTPEFKKDIEQDVLVQNSVPVKQSGMAELNLQIGCLNLGKIESLKNLIEKKNLPNWQYTAFDSYSGGCWLGYSYLNDENSRDEFSQEITKHLELCGIPADDIIIEFFENAGNSVSQILPGLAKFYHLITDELYDRIKINSMKSLLDNAELFSVEYNYKRNYKSGLNLPPHQLIRRKYNNDTISNIFEFKPVLINNSLTRKARYLFGLKMITGMIGTLAGSMISRKSKVKINRGVSSKNIKPPIVLSQTEHQAQKQNHKDTEITNKKIEFINLKNINSVYPADKLVAKEKQPEIGRNRQELIALATKLLEQKRSVIEIKNRLPITEGELSMLNMKIMTKNRKRLQ